MPGRKPERGGEGTSLLEEMKDRFMDRFSPKTLRSRLFWEMADRLSRSRLNRPQWKADRVSLAYFIRITRDAYLGRAPVVWSNLLVPSELIIGSGCLPFYPEMVAAVVAAAGLAPRFIDRSTECGFSPDACSFHRCILGCALEDFLPAPDLLLTSSYPCDSAPLSFDHAAGLYGSRHIVLDYPLPDRPGGRELLAEQVEGAALQMADLAGMDAGILEESMARSVELSNQALYYLRQVEELRKSSDCTLDGRDAMGAISVLAACLGSEAGAEFYRLLAEELRERGREGEDSLRLMWMHIKPWYSQKIFDILEGHGVRVVCEEYTHACWDSMDPADPYMSLAAKMGGHFLVGPAHRRASHLTRLASEYRVDGAIHYNHWGCRQSCGGAVLVKRSLLQIGVPTLLLDGDCVDEREFQEGQVSTRLEAFLESLAG